MNVNKIQFAVFIAVGFLVGCSKSPELVPATGTITIGGKPAANISIQFLPNVTKNDGTPWPSSHAISGADGSFELRTSGNLPGAVPGEHNLILVDTDEERPAQGQNATKPPRIDSSYTVAGKVKAVVEAGKPIEIKIP